MKLLRLLNKTSLLYLAVFVVLGFLVVAKINANTGTDQQDCDDQFGVGNTTYSSGVCYANNQTGCDEIWGLSNTQYTSTLGNSTNSNCIAINQAGCNAIYGSGNTTYSLVNSQHRCIASSQSGCNALYGTNNTLYLTTPTPTGNRCLPVNQTGCNSVFGTGNTTYAFINNQYYCLANNQSGCDAIYMSGNTIFVNNGTPQNSYCRPASQQGCDIFYGAGNTTYNSTLTECVANNQTGCDNLFPGQNKVYSGQGTTNAQRCAPKALPDTSIISENSELFLGGFLIFIGLYIVVFMIKRNKTGGDNRYNYLRP